MRIASAGRPRRSSRVAQLPIQVAGGIFVVGEKQYLLPAQFARQQLFELCELGVSGGRDGLDIPPYLAQGVDIPTQVVVQPLEVVARGIERGQALDELARFGVRVQLIGERAGCSVVLLIFANKVAHSSLKTCTVQHFTLQDIALESFKKFQRTAHADTESIDAALEAFEVAALEDTDEGLFTPLFKLVARDALFLVGFQAIRGEFQALDTVDNLLVDAVVGSFQVIAYGFQFAFGPANGLPFDSSAGIGLFDKGARAPDDHFFQQIEEGDAALLLASGTPGCQEVVLQVADTGSREIAAVAPREEVHLVVQVEDGIVDGSSGQQDEFFTLATDFTAPVVRGQQAFQALVAMGAAVAEVMALVYQHNVGILRIAAVELITPHRFLGDDARRDARAQQFILPHLLQSGRTNYNSTI